MDMLDLLRAEKQVEWAARVTSRKRRILYWTDNAQICGFQQWCELLHATVVVEVAADDGPLAALDNACDLCKLLLTYRCMEREMSDEQREITTDGDVIEELFRSMLKLPCPAGELIDTKNAVTVVTEERKAPEHARFPVLRIDVLAAVGTEAFEKGRIMMHLKQAADIRLNVLDECAEAFVDRLYDGIRRVQIPPGLRDIASQRAVETGLVPEIQQQDSVCLHLYYYIIL